LFDAHNRFAFFAPQRMVDNLKTQTILSGKERRFASWR
jgi:hypothetical protein